MSLDALHRFFAQSKADEAATLVLIVCGSHGGCYAAFQALLLLIAAAMVYNVWKAVQAQ